MERSYLGKLLCVDNTIMYSTEKHNSPDSSIINKNNNFVKGNFCWSLAKKYFEYFASQFAISVVCEAQGLCEMVSSLSTIARTDRKYARGLQEQDIHGECIPRPTSVLQK